MDSKDFQARWVHQSGQRSSGHSLTCCVDRRTPHTIFADLRNITDTIHAHHLVSLEARVKAAICSISEKMPVFLPYQVLHHQEQYVYHLRKKPSWILTIIHSYSFGAWEIAFLAEVQVGKSWCRSIHEFAQMNPCKKDNSLEPQRNDARWISTGLDLD